MLEEVGGFKAEFIVLFIAGVNGMMEILLPRYTSSAILISYFGFKNGQSLITHRSPNY